MEKWWDIISHENIQRNQLNTYGLHFNREGTAILARNIVNFLWNINWPNYISRISPYAPRDSQTTSCNYNPLSISTLSNLDVNETENPLSPTISPFSKLKGFKIGHLNITSLSKHLDEFLIYMEKQPFDILTIDETPLDSTIHNREVEIHGYDIVRKKTAIEMEEA